VTRSVVVVRPHVSKYPDPVRFRRGDRITVGDRDPEFPGWIRVTDPCGRSGWAPEVLLDGVFGFEAEAIEDYDATELNVVPGERLVVHRELAGWFWVCNEDGTLGWVPADSIRVGTR